jgi:tetratricopeptide (TPR) repeat protein
MTGHLSPRTALLSILSVCWVLTGCTQTASFRQLRSARVDTSLYRVAVVNVAGPREESGEAGTALWDELGRSGCYQLVHEDQLQQWSRRPLRYENQNPNVPAVVDAARHAGVDGILIARIRFIESDGSLYGSKVARFGDPEVAAEMKYVLIDTRSGSVVGQNQVKSDFYRGELESGRGPQSEFAVFSKLARQAGDRVAQELAPHETVVEVKLAQGGGDVREGIKAAKEGDWRRAKQHWSAAVQADAENDAAQYNLGLACEATGDLSGARHCYETALSLKSNNTYQQALDRLKRTEADVRLAWSQKAQAVAQIAAAAAPHHSLHPAARPARQPTAHAAADSAAYPAARPAAHPTADPGTHPPAYPAAHPSHYAPQEAAPRGPTTWQDRQTW